MSREKISREMRVRLGLPTDFDLMNELHLQGLVSDNALNITDVPDSDLVRAFNRIVKSHQDQQKQKQK